MRADTKRYRTAMDLLSTILATLVGVLASLATSLTAWNKIGNEPDLLYIGLAVVLGVAVLILFGTYVIKHFTDRNVQKDKLQHAVEHAFLHALDASPLNPNYPRND